MKTTASHTIRPGLTALAIASLLAAVACVLAIAAPVASAATTPPEASANYKIVTLDNQNDPTFNQLLGIDNAGLIAGYFGSGATGHPNKGYLLASPYGQGNYKSENVTGAVETQVTGLNGTGTTVGFFVDKEGDSHGFYAIRGRPFHTVDFPAHNNSKPQVDQLLGVNESDVAVGFYTAKDGMTHGFSYDISTQRFHTVTVAGDSNLTAAAINNEGDIAGFATNSAGVTVAFLARPGSQPIELSVPGSTSTQALGVNDGDEVAGDYTVAGEGGATDTHGFVWSPGFGFETVNDANGIDTTTINGVNDRGDLVGFYTDADENTDGLLATPEV
ncbi:MAG TPA: hypothetical protein VMF09_15630 [Solirubrobacteraceae bacterium]|nr:hypothetical protein [Solirubrobacteraceae bacterium]